MTSEIEQKTKDGPKVSTYQFLFLNLAENANFAGFNHLRNDTRDTVAQNFETPGGETGFPSTEELLPIQTSTEPPTTSEIVAESTTESTESPITNDLEDPNEIQGPSTTGQVWRCSQIA